MRCGRAGGRGSGGAAEVQGNIAELMVGPDVPGTRVVLLVAKAGRRVRQGMGGATPSASACARKGAGGCARMLGGGTGSESRWEAAAAASA